MRTIVIGSRKSNLALTQSRGVMNQLKQVSPELSIEIEKVVTKGDRILDVTLSRVGGKGLFVKEIEKALLEGQIDLAVHSMKDLPAEIAENLVIGAIPKRVDPRDCFLSREGVTLEELPSGSVVGTSSLRRQAQILAQRPDVRVEPVRGNIETRMQKMKSGQYDAIVLAAAGIERMNYQEEVTEYLPVSTLLPAVGQGALAVQCRAEDKELLHLLRQIHDKETARAITAERAFLQTIEGGCHLPIAAYAEVIGEKVRLTGLVAHPEGRKVLQETQIGVDEESLGRDLANHLMEQGADKLLAYA